jgi:hypothetical protein
MEEGTMHETFGLRATLSPVSPTTPVPENVELSGLPTALLVMVTDPEKVPALLGSKVTLTEQLAPGFSIPALSPLGMQLLLVLKLDPVEVIDVMVTGAD